MIRLRLYDLRGKRYVQFESGLKEPPTAVRIGERRFVLAADGKYRETSVVTGEMHAVPIVQSADSPRL